MIDRRHEKLTLDALEDLVGYLRDVREERKAILAITDGWRLFRPNENLARPLTLPRKPCRRPDDRRSIRGREADHEGPRDRCRRPRKCDRDRMDLAHLDDDLTFRQLLDEANRANASFYPIDPRGLAVFDTPLGTDGPGRRRTSPPSVDPRCCAAGSTRCARSPKRPTASPSSTRTISPEASSASSTTCRPTTCSATTRPASWTESSIRSRCA